MILETRHVTWFPAFFGIFFGGVLCEHDFLVLQITCYSLDIPQNRKQSEHSFFVPQQHR